MKSARISHLCKVVLFHLGIFGLIRRWYPRKELAVLRYHSVSSPDCLYASPGICVTPEGFRKQIRYFVKHYPVLPLDEAIEQLQAGQPLPENALAITFDDGYADNYAAFKILREYGVSATFFLTSNCIDDKEVFWVAEVYSLLSQTTRRELQLCVKDRLEAFRLESPSQRQVAIARLTKLIKSCTIPEREVVRQQLRSALDDVTSLWDGSSLMLTTAQIQEMIAGGMSIGGHTLTHCNLPSAGISDARHEMRQCRLDLEQRFGLPVKAFAYPNGGAEAYFNKDIQLLVQEAGYYSAWTSEHGFVHAGTDWYRSPRVVATESLAEMVYLLEGDRIREVLQK